MPSFEFHITRAARARYQVDAALFTQSGNVIFADVRAARQLAQKMNAARPRALPASHLFAMGLIDELLHYVVKQYRQQVAPRALSDALAWLESALGKETLDATLLAFVREFPNVAVYRGEIDASQFLEGVTDGIAHREIVLEEVLMLWLANENPAFAPFLELFDDTPLEQNTAYQTLVTSLHDFFETQPHFGPDNQNLVEMLRTPARVAPDSLEAQLAFIRTRWATLLGDYLRLVLLGLDILQEEARLFFGGAGPARVPEFRRGARGIYEGEYPEDERFSRDLDWMPRVVLIAKSTYVWLDQLSKKYHRAITRLDQIPDEELDALARAGFTALWLIGVWQRSPASKRIKELCGALNAEASAYAVYDYRIADDLGGDAALENLKARAWQRGIRLASDLVPNHTGIDSRWVVEHPDWFISTDTPPFPSYSFTGENLSRDPRVGIFLEDHYLNRSDAAVVFKRVDFATGEVKYIYHGNDGTSFPWNDTAQLNFLKPEVREAVIQTILRVARQFPILRLDAAMTLTKRHYQRLWFPQPGTGGAIPSRAEFAMSKEAFDAAMPQEFWREVVDRVNAEAPDTLLLAEAFWLMEGYFVRTLGMHRVYNSAFMNMLRDEENAKYRAVIKNTLEFDPEILKRYVNFVNNPDERTAVDQFGKGDKYFGVTTMMVTLPGLPMFGHGQIEGYAERYGMEFRRALWDEQPDPALIERHEREIFPLLHRRALFAEAENFLLYDFFTPHGVVDENVFAYSNRRDAERALIVYHNKFADTRGWIRTSAAYLDKASGKLVQKTLGEGLALPRDPQVFVVFRDYASGSEYIRPSVELWEQGLYVELGAYQRHVFLDFRVVTDAAAHPYARLCAALNGRGVPSVEEAVRHVYWQPIHQPFRALVNIAVLQRLLEVRDARRRRDWAVLDDLQSRYAQWIRAVKQFTGGTGNEVELVLQMRREIERLLALRVSHLPKWMRAYFKDEAVWVTLALWVLVHNVGRAQDEYDYAARGHAWLSEWQLDQIIVQALCEWGLSHEHAWRAVNIVKLMTRHQDWFAVRKGHAANLIAACFGDDDACEFLGVNFYDGVWWFRKEAFEELLWWAYATTLVSVRGTVKQFVRVRRTLNETVHTLRTLGRQSKYRIEKLRALVV